MHRYKSQGVSGNRSVLVFLTGSTILTSIVRTACDLEEARLRLVAPTERFLVASLSEDEERSKTDGELDARIDSIELLFMGNGYRAEIGNKNHSFTLADG